MGSVDRVTRLLVAVILVVLYYVGIITGILAIVLLAFSAVFFLTSLISTCPLYLPFGLSTLRQKKSEPSRKG